MRLTTSKMAALCAAACALAVARLTLVCDQGSAVRWARRGCVNEAPLLGVRQLKRRDTLAWAVVALGSRRLVGASCLEQSLALTNMLRLARIPGRLVIGVSRRAEFHAHAWVESGGDVILGAAQAEGMTALLSSSSNPSNTASCPAS